MLASGTFTYGVFACSLIAFQALPFLVDPASPQATLAMGTLASIWFSLDGLAAIPFLLAVGWATLATKTVLPRGFATVGAGAHPVVRGEAVNTATTYGYDSVTMMQETKTTVCQIERATA